MHIGRQRQVNLCEFKASLSYSASSRTGSKVTQRNLVGGAGKGETSIKKQVKSTVIIFHMIPIITLSCHSAVRCSIDGALFLNLGAPWYTANIPEAFGECIHKPSND